MNVETAVMRMQRRVLQVKPRATQVFIGFPEMYSMIRCDVIHYTCLEELSKMFYEIEDIKL